MANDNSQSPKDSKNILSAVVEPIRSFFSNPSEGSQGHSSKRPRRKLFSKFKSTSLSQSTLSQLSPSLTSSTEYPGGEIPLGKYLILSMYILNCNPIVDSTSLNVTALDGMPPNRLSLMLNSSQYPDHRILAPPTSSGSHSLSTSPAVQSERPYDSVPLVRLIVVHRSGRSFISAGSNYDLCCWSISW